MSSQILFEMYRGDDYTLRVEITDSNAVAIDITGWSFISSMKLSTEMSDDYATVSVDIPAASGADAEAGIVYVVLPSAQTVNLLPTQYVIDLQLSFNGKVTTVFVGQVSVLGDVTWRTG